MRRFYLLCIFGFVALSALAESRSLSDAKRIASAFMSRSSNYVTDGDVSFTSVTTGVQSGIKGLNSSVPDYYILNADDSSGYVIVSGDDRFTDILGYSNEGTFDAENIPDGLAYLLSLYSQEMEYAKKYYGEDSESFSDESLLTSSGTSVEPLIKTHWSQIYPFNSQVPVAYSGSPSQFHGKASIGCVALAMAQVMNYWKYPSQGQGGIYSNINYKNVSVDFSSQTYDWDNIAPEYGSYYDGSWKTGEYTSSQAEEVSKVCYHAGVLVNMLWNSDKAGGSGASEIYIVGGMANYLGYNPYARLIFRDVLGLDGFSEIIVDNLSCGLPVIMCGMTKSSSGHCFILDGYDASSEKFHVNWGWQGSDNGYFSLSAMNSNLGNFNYNQTIIAGMQPESQDFGYDRSIYFAKAKLMESSISKGGTFIISIDSLYWSDSMFEGQPGIVIYDSEGNVKSSTFSNKDFKLGYMYSFNMSSPKLSKSLPAGTYTMCIAVKDNEGDISPISAFYSRDDRWTLTVSSSSATGTVIASGYNNVATSISQPTIDMSVSESSESDTWYTITGTPVAAPSKGIYIRGRKKYIFR